MTIYIQYSDCGNHIRRWSREPFDGGVAYVALPMDELCAERVVLACAAATAVPGDAWTQGAEGHYAFLAGLAALLGNEVSADGFERNVIAQSRWLSDDHSMRCPDRVLLDFGFLPAPRAEGGK